MTNDKHGVPDGWKLVPVEPTAEMKIAGDNAPWWCADKYRAMLGAAPEAPPSQASEPLTDEVIEAIERLCVKPVDANGWGFLDRKAFARAIEAAHGIKP